jgi:predicted alpha-1,6-mannanase (GH76 family)
MKLNRFADLLRAHGAPCLPVIALLVSCAAPVAHAQWAASDAQAAFSDYNTAFYFSPSSGNYDYRKQQGSTSTIGFWTGAETIELAEDAYELNPTTSNQTIVSQLCNGFVAQNTGNWSGDSYDDDLMWATIAFTRAYQITGNSTWLSDAETNFATVWSRGYDSSGGGIWWDTPADNNRVSASNWTFVIAGNMLYNITGNSTYQSEAKTIYTWAMANLYDASNGEVYDGVGSSGTSKSQYTYNYGTAIGANYYENDFSDANNMATYMIANFNNNGTYDGYNIMPNYGQGGTDGGGFNGIALRYVGYGLAHGEISNSSVLPWAQDNVSHAWSQRNSSGLSFNNWATSTPSGTNLYGWDCSDTVVGMQVIPVSSSTLIANGTYIVTNVNSGMAIDDPGSSKTDGKDMQQYTVNNGTNQQWNVTNLGNNVITLTNVSSGQLLDVAAASRSNGALVDQYPSNNGNNQKWQVLYLGGGVYTLTSINSGLALDVKGASKSTGAAIDQYPYETNTWQQWKFTSY